MNNIENKAIVLKLNRLWRAVGIGVVGKTICDMMTGVVMGIDIVYATDEDGNPNFELQEYAAPVSWDQWMTLPVRPWDLSIHSAKFEMRVPTVVVTSNYAKIPKKTFKGKPTKEALAIRDNLIDPYTGNELDFNEATKDHVIPLSRGGTDTYDNVVLTTKEINNRKGNRLNSEAGLTMLFNPSQPKPVLFPQTIRKIRHQDWKLFLESK